ERLAIPAVSDLRGVGRNLQDHVLAGIFVACPEPLSLYAAESPRQLLRYLLLRRGMLTSNGVEAAALAAVARRLSLGRGDAAPDGGRGAGLRPRGSRSPGARRRDPLCQRVVL